MIYIKKAKPRKIFNAGFIEKWDFSKANSCMDARIEAVCEVAKTCRNMKEIRNPKALYEKLLIEHSGNPSEIMQFIPVVLSHHDEWAIDDARFNYDYGEMLLTNLRNVISKDNGWFNSEVEGFEVFRIKVPYMIVPQIIRHGQISINQRSEQHCKNREYFMNNKLKKVYISECGEDLSYNEWILTLSQNDFDRIGEKYKLGQSLTNKGSHGLSYTELWMAGWRQDFTVWQNYFDVRLKKPTQKEHIELARAIINF